MKIESWGVLLFLVAVLSIVFYQLCEVQGKLDKLNVSIMQCLPIDIYTQAIMTEENYLNSQRGGESLNEAE